MFMYCTVPTCGRPPFNFDVNDIIYWPMLEIGKENYSVGSRVKYQCNTTAGNNTQPESGSSKSYENGAFWNISVLCNKNGAWSYQLSNQIYIHGNLTRSLPAKNSLDSDNQDPENSYWV